MPFLLEHKSTCDCLNTIDFSCHESCFNAIYEGVIYAFLPLPRCRPDLVALSLIAGHAVLVTWPGLPAGAVSIDTLARIGGAS